MSAFMAFHSSQQFLWTFTSCYCPFLLLCYFLPFHLQIPLFSKCLAFCCGFCGYNIWYRKHRVKEAFQFNCKLNTASNISKLHIWMGYKSMSINRSWYLPVLHVKGSCHKICINAYIIVLIHLMFCVVVYAIYVTVVMNAW